MSTTMKDHPPTSILLPTTSWTAVIDELAEQLTGTDELLIICDSETDSITDHTPDFTSNTKLVIAGEPEGCSGKANAIATGMEAAQNEHIVWTDDDFHHPDDWLSQLHDDYAQNGPTTELAFFTGRDALSFLFEPLYAIAGTLGTYTNEIAWGGAVIFHRGDLPDEEAFRRDLLRTISDDGLLTDRVDITPVKRVRQVKMGGSFRETLERHVRFTQLGRHHDPKGSVLNGFIGTITTIAGLLFPIQLFIGLTILFAGVYTAFGVRRWTFVLGYPAVMISMPLMFYALLRKSFVWGGRRYRWNTKFDVEIVGS